MNINSDEPLVSIAIPTYNRDDLIKDTIESVIDQDFEYPFELIIVDNCSRTDSYQNLINYINSLKIDLSIKVYRNSVNIDMYSNFDVCVSYCNSDWVIILHDDDIISRNFISSAYKKVSSDVSLIYSYNVIYDQRIIVDESIHEYGSRLFKNFPKCNFDYEEITSDELLFSNIIGNSSGVLFSKNKYLQCGGVRSSEYPSSDYFLWFRLMSLGKCIRSNKSYLCYRILNNDSLKESTCKSFLELDLRLRKILITDKNFFENTIFLFLFYLQKYNSISVLRKTWGINLLKNQQFKIFKYVASSICSAINMSRVYKSLLKLNILRKINLENLMR